MSEFIKVELDYSYSEPLNDAYIEKSYLVIKLSNIKYVEKQILKNSGKIICYLKTDNGDSMIISENSFNKIEKLLLNKKDDESKPEKYKMQYVGNEKLNVGSGKLMNGRFGEIE